MCARLADESSQRPSNYWGSETLQMCDFQTTLVMGTGEFKASQLRTDTQLQRAGPEPGTPLGVRCGAPVGTQVRCSEACAPFPAHHSKAQLPSRGRQGHMPGAFFPYIEAFSLFPNQSIISPSAPLQPKYLACLVGKCEGQLR